MAAAQLIAADAVHPVPAAVKDAMRVGVVRDAQAASLP
jgi:hypothetical protein